jgi:uncharacterized membrane protein
MKAFIALGMVFLSLLGIADASYLTYEKLSGYIPLCGQGFDCGAVLSSPYASIGPVPISALGILFYLSIFALAICYYLEVPLDKSLKLPWLNISWLLLGITSTGFAFSVILVGLMAFVIEAWCLYCLVSAIISTLLFIGSVLLNRLTNSR